MGKKLVPGVNDLATLRPDLVVELVDESLATQLTIGTDKKVEWRCKPHGHIWSAAVSSRTAGRGCPYCANKAVLAGYNDLATLRPDLAAELLDQSLATQVTVGSGRRVEWRCKPHGHIWSSTVDKRSGGQECGVCSSLATLRPDLAAELVDQSLATQLSVSSGRKVEWRCKPHGHIWSALVSNRAKGGGCPYCSGRAVIPGETDLATLRPDLVAELVDQSLATQLSVWSNKTVEWRCKSHGHIWSAVVSSRSNGNGCPYCSGRAVIPGETDLATLRPDLAAELVDQSLAIQLSVSSNVRVEWRCKPHGHTWSVPVSARSSGRGCPVCVGQVVLAGYNDLATLRPDLVAELVDQSLATTLAVGTHKKVQWRCKPHGHIWSASVASRSSIGSGCPYCANKAVLAGYNDLATLRPDLAAELVDQSLATQVTVASGRKVEWRCKPHGHIWPASVVHRSTRNQGCPECNPGGFSSVGIGWLYLLATPGRRVFKYGITNDLDGRLDRHYRQGFSEIVETKMFQYGGDAAAIETALRRHKKAMGWQHGMTKADMPDGYSETLLADECGYDFTLTGFIATLAADDD